MIDIAAYLQRIGYAGSATPDLDTLHRLQQAHLLTVPFENLDIALGRSIILDEATLLHKIVDHRRGGFCYEANGAFAALLRALGFRVSLLSAGVAHKTGGFGPDFDHLVLLVHLAEPWLVDVGFDTQQKPLFQGAGIYNGACVDPATNGFTNGGTYGCKLSNGWWMQITALRRGTVLLVTKDAGSPLLWPILALLVLSLYVTFSFPPRRFWVQIRGDQVWMAALKEHTLNLQRDLDTFARALGNAPLRPAAPEAVPVKRAAKKESR